METELRMLEQYKPYKQILLDLHVHWLNYVHQETTAEGKPPLDKKERTLLSNCLTNKAGN